MNIAEEYDSFQPLLFPKVLRFSNVVRMRFVLSDFLHKPNLPILISTVFPEYFDENCNGYLLAPTAGSIQQVCQSRGKAHQPRRAYEQPWINGPPESIVDDIAM